MKRIFPFILFFLVVVGATYVIYGSKITISFNNAPGQASEDDEHVRETAAAGKVQSLGTVAIPGSGTHILVQKDKKTILLSGLGVNLDAYIGKQVEIEGRPTTTASGKDLIQVLRLRELTAEEVAAVEPVISKAWIPFEDSTLGVKFLKRDFWKALSEKDTITLTIPADLSVCGIACDTIKDDTITLERLDNTKGATLVSFAGDAKLASHNVIGTKSLSGYKFTAPDGKITAVVAREKFVFRLVYTPGSVKSADGVANDFHSLLNSFEFIPLLK